MTNPRDPGARKTTKRRSLVARLVPYSGLVFWPTVITLVVNVARYAFEVGGVLDTGSGGGFQPLGIVWLGFVFGAWFAWRLHRRGSRARVSGAPVWAAVAMALVVVAVLFWFGPLAARGDSGAASGIPSPERAAALVRAGFSVATAAVVGALVCFVVWPRLAFVLLVYAIPARVTVLVLTALAKMLGQDTHYTRFGPGGWEYGFGETMERAALAQLLFWVPFTVVSGVLAGTVATVRIGGGGKSSDGKSAGSKSAGGTSSPGDGARAEGERAES